MLKKKKIERKIAVKYISTRSVSSQGADFEDVLLSGLAPDGGLFLPRRWPHLRRAVVRGFAGAPYQDVAQSCFAPFIGAGMRPEKLRGMIDEAYSGFSHPAVAPLRQISPHQWMLELWHGPSLAFKDLAMQFLSRLLDDALARHSMKATIVCATSGDTGAAAMAGFADSPHVDLFVLYPRGRISSVQRRQMTTHTSENVHAVCVDGDFDDCQAIVKALFGDEDFRQQAQLAAVNSINWARVMAQTAYYFSASTALNVARGEKVHFVVPTGNFGNIYAGYVAKCMGAPIGRLVIASNQNDVLVRALKNRHYSPQQVAPTLSPSMDIQLPSNFERFLFEAYGRMPRRVNKLLAELRVKSETVFPHGVYQKMKREFDAVSISDDETLETIRNHYDATGAIIDPHSAVGLAAAGRVKLPSGPVVILSTAHAAKFPSAIKEAIGITPHSSVLDVKGRDRIHRVANDPSAVASFIRAQARIFH